MSAIYHPQNAYCVALDGKSKEEFKNGVQKLAKCFPNIKVIVNSLTDFSIIKFLI